MITFEKTGCTRCGGGGRYSFCMTMGGPFGPETCFKCNGTGTRYTARGQAAYNLFIRAHSTRACNLKAGDMVAKHMTYGPWIAVERAEQETAENHSGCSIVNGVPQYHFVVKTSYCTHHCSPDSLWLTQPSAAKARHISQLITEYQGLLGKNGKPYKKAEARAAEIRAELET